MAIPEGRQQSLKNNGLYAKPTARRAIDLQEKIPALVNRQGAKENPGALAGTTGVKGVKEAGRLRGKNSPKRHNSAMSKWAKPAHKKVARAVGFVLTLGFNGQRAAELAMILSARLDPQERAGLAYAALQSLPEDDAYKIASLVLFGVWNGEAVR